MKIRNIFTAAALAVVIAAGSARAAEPAAPATLFEYPSVPDKLTKPAMRANFMVEHLWDKCDLKKTAVTDLAAFHNTFTDYLSFFALADKAVVEKSIKKYVERVAKNPTNLNLTVGMLHSDVLNLRSQYCSASRQPERHRSTGSPQAPQSSFSTPTDASTAQSTKCG